MSSYDSFTAILLASGKGERAKTYKQFLEINQKPLYRYSLDVLRSLFKNIILTLPPFYENKKDFEVKEKDLKVIYGGHSRQESVYKALKEVNTPFVIIHDSARPNIRLDDVKKLLDLESFDGKTLYVKPRDLVKLKVKEKFIVPKKEDVYIVYTPQSFKTDILLECHERAIKEGVEVFDDTTLLDFYGYKVGYEESSFWNIKLTYEEDIAFFKKILN